MARRSAEGVDPEATALPGWIKPQPTKRVD
jgi:hypothetical protein